MSLSSMSAVVGSDQPGIRYEIPALPMHAVHTDDAVQESPIHSPKKSRPEPLQVIDDRIALPQQPSLFWIQSPF
jgi:hypothetical protein